MVFAYILGLITNSSSVNKIAGHCSDSPIVKEILGGTIPSQSALSRFFSKKIDWLKCSFNRIELFLLQLKLLYIKAILLHLMIQNRASLWKETTFSLLLI